MKIWGRANSINVMKVLWAADECGVKYDREDVGGAFGGNDKPWYLKMNPNGVVPTIEDGGRIIWESNSCVRYLAARYAAGSLWPNDPGARSEADRWMDWQLTMLQPAISPVFWGLIRTPPERRDMAAITASAERLGQAMQILDRQLHGRPFVAGDRLTMGDVPVGCVCWRYANLDIARPALPAVDAYRQRLEARAAYRDNVMLPLV